MARNSVAERLEVLEADVARLKAEIERLNQPKDWRSAGGFFTGDSGMLEVFKEARKIREADRRKFKREHDRKYRQNAKA